jgi:hypothetical protein
MSPQVSRNTGNAGISCTTFFTSNNGNTRNTGNSDISGNLAPYPCYEHSIKLLNKNRVFAKEPYTSYPSTQLPVIYTSLSELVMAGSFTKSRTPRFNAQLSEISKSKVGASYTSPAIPVQSA